MSGMLDLPCVRYLTERQARALRAGMRANTVRGRRLRTELIDIVTMWMNGEVFPAELAPVTTSLLQRNDLGGGMNANQHTLAFNYLWELYDDERASVWFNKPHELLGWRKPVEARYVEVLALIDQIKTGALI